MKKTHPDNSQEKSQGAGGREEPRRTGGADDPRSRVPLRGVENAPDDRGGPIPPIQTSAAYDAIEKAWKNARIRRPEIVGDDEPAPVPPAQIAARYEAADEPKKNLSTLGEVGALVPEEDADRVDEGHPGVERVVSLVGPPPSTPLPESSPSATTQAGASAVGIDIRPTPLVEDEPNEPEPPTLEAMVVEDALYDAFPLEEGGGSLVEQPSVKTERCIWKYILALCLLAVIGLVIFFVVYYGVTDKKLPLTCLPIDCLVSTWESWTPCTATCDGKRNRTREIVVNQDCSGAPCPYVFEEQDCNVNCCLDCETTFWGDWSTCSSECGGGNRRRNRTVVFYNDSCGQPCPFLEEVQECNTEPCPVEEGPGDGKEGDGKEGDAKEEDVKERVQGEGVCQNKEDCEEDAQYCSRNPSCAYHQCIGEELCGCTAGRCFYIIGAPEAAGEGGLRDITTPLNVGGGIAHASAGSNYTVIVLEDGSALSGGHVEKLENYHGHLGLIRDAVGQGINDFRSVATGHNRALLADAPRFIKAFAGVESVPGSEAMHTMLLDDQGRAWAMGSNAKGQLCLSDDVDRMMPERVPLASRIVDIAIGGEHTLLLDESGVVHGCGSNSAGQIGLGSKERIGFGPTALDSIRSPVANISCGHSHSMFLTTDGILYLFGSNAYGQLCADTDGGDVPTPTALHVGQQTIASFTAMKESSLILYEDGTVGGCGRNDFGQIGSEPATESIVAAKLEGGAVRLLGSGPSAHSAFFAEDDLVLSTGLNDRGQLGVGDTSNKQLPATVHFNGPIHIDLISASEVHTVALGTMCIDCKPSPWSDFGPCSVNCGVGNRTRTRTIAQAPTPCGKPCPVMEEIEECFIRDCNPGEINGPANGPSGPIGRECCQDPCQGVLEGDGGEGGGLTCQSDADCTPGTFCSEDPNCAYQRCVSCNNPEICPDGMYCDCRTGTYLPCTVDCCQDLDCSAGEVCIEGICCEEGIPPLPVFGELQPCCQDSHCELGKCQGGFCCAHECCSHDVCGAGLKCSEQQQPACAFGRCVQCQGRFDCGENQFCNCDTGRCEEIPCFTACCPDCSVGEKCINGVCCKEGTPPFPIFGEAQPCCRSTDCDRGTCQDGFCCEHACCSNSMCGAGLKCSQQKQPDCAFGTCVQCVADLECSENEQCNCDTGRCEEPPPCPYECCTDANCPPSCPGHEACPGEMFCSDFPTCKFRQCVHCDTDDDCTPQKCDCDTGRCEEPPPCPYECCTDANCPPSCPGHEACPGEMFCSDFPSCKFRQCVHCDTDDDCTPQKCDCDTGRCEEPPPCPYECCADSRDCPPGCTDKCPGDKFCSVNPFVLWHKCVHCDVDHYCTEGESCDTEIGECRHLPCPYECCVGAGCPQACTVEDEQCPGDLFCSNTFGCAWRTCVECNSDYDCSENPATQVCDCTTGRCVARPCDTDDDCAEGEICKDGKCIEAPPCPYECCTDNACPRGCPGHEACSGDMFCSDNPTCKFRRCVHCDTDDDCWPEECDCSRGVCEEPAPCPYECCTDNNCPSSCPGHEACSGDMFCSDNPTCKFRRCVHCDTDDDCWPEECDCSRGVCKPECSNDGDCPWGEECNGGTCEEASCPYECCDFGGCPPSCGGCGGGKFCSDNPSCAYRKCVNCDTEDDCGPYEHCDCGSGECRPLGGTESRPEPDQCREHYECPKGEVCERGKCKRTYFPESGPGPKEPKDPPKPPAAKEPKPKPAPKGL